jgi:AcrR family transcriptional regulator
VGVSDRKEREKAEMKAKILGAARELFLTVGFEKTSIRGIAELIEYSPSTIYLYFKDKDELLFALHTEAFEGLMLHFLQVSEITDPIEKLVKLGDEYLAFAFENPELYELMFLMLAPIDSLACGEEVWHDGRILIGVLEGIIDECKKNGHFKNINTQELSMLTWAQVHGLATIHLKRRTMMFEESERMPRIMGAMRLFIETLKNL